MTDLEARAFTRRGNALIPSDFAADELLAELKEGEEILIVARKARSIPNHRHYFALLRAAVTALPERLRIQTEEDLLEALKLAVGHVRRVMKLDGSVVLVPASINFASLPEGAFKRFKDRTLYVLGRVIGCDSAELGRQADETQKKRAA